MCGWKKMKKSTALSTKIIDNLNFHETLVISVILVSVAVSVNEYLKKNNQLKY